jgi:hypothetical protein
MSGQAGNGNQGFSARETTPGLDTRHAHSARVYNYWLGGEDNFAADREAAEQAIAACDYVDADLRDTSAILRAASATLDLSQPVAFMLLIILHLISDADDPYDIVATLLRALPAGSYVVLAHPASDIRAAQMAEMTKRVNQRMSGPKATMRDRAEVTRFFDGLELLEPGVVQPQQWRPEPGVLSPPQVTAWCGVARKP